MAKKTETNIKITEDEYWSCERCEIDNVNFGGRKCPCPRGSCDAEHTGTVTTTVEVKIHPIEPIKHNKAKINYPTVEEMYCRTCMSITGHWVKSEKWTCVLCDNI